MGGKMSETVGEAFPGELARCEGLIERYRELEGGVGFFGAMMIDQIVADAKAAWASGDVVRIVGAFAAMKECE
jgi:hypothetical protein